MVGIYKIQNKINGKIYIGQSVNIDKRFRKHKSVYKNPKFKHYHYPLYQDMRKYGLDNFSFEVVEECLEEELNEKEIQYIKYFQSFDFGYNQNAGGHCAINRIKLTKQDIANIIKKLKTSKENSEVIGEEFGVSGRTIRAINLGESYYNSKENYPIRESLCYTEKPRQYFCSMCGKSIKTNSKYCIECGCKSQYRAKRPLPLELAKMIAELGFVNTGKKFGVSGNAIKKWCIQYGMPYLKKDVVNWYKNQNK